MCAHRATIDPDDLEDPANCATRCTRRCSTARPARRSRPLRAHQPEVLRAFIYAWERLFKAAGSSTGTSRNCAGFASRKPSAATTEAHIQRAVQSGIGRDESLQIANEEKLARPRRGFESVAAFHRTRSGARASLLPTHIVLEPCERRRARLWKDRCTPTSRNRNSSNSARSSVRHRGPASAGSRTLGTAGHVARCVAETTIGL